MLRFHCPRCNKRFKAHAEYAGRNVQCTKCGSRVIIGQGEVSTSSKVAQETSILQPQAHAILNCPHCSGPVGNDGRMAGQAVSCPHCRNTFIMPGLAVTSPSPATAPVGQDLISQLEEAVSAPLTRSEKPRGPGGIVVPLLALLIGIVLGVGGTLLVVHRPMDQKEMASVKPSSAPLLSVPDTPPAQTPIRPSTKTTPTIEQARALLKTTLDSWVFGESIEKFREKHPDVEFAAVVRPGNSLVRYEILAEQPGTPTERFEVDFEFVVTLTLQPKFSNEVSKENHKCAVRRERGKTTWIILCI